MTMDQRVSLSSPDPADRLRYPQLVKQARWLVLQAGALLKPELRRRLEHYLIEAGDFIAIDRKGRQLDADGKPMWADLQ